MSTSSSSFKIKLRYLPNPIVRRTQQTCQILIIIFNFSRSKFILQFMALRGHFKSNLVSLYLYILSCNLCLPVCLFDHNSGTPGLICLKL